jgi:glutathione S-transferase
MGAGIFPPLAWEVFMYTLFWSPGSVSMLPHGVLEELGAPYRLELVDISKDRHKEKAYLEINPSGKIPALALPSGDIMSEAVAISMYLADQYPDAGLTPRMNDPKRASYYQWMTYLTNTVQANAMRFYYPHRFTMQEAGKDQIVQKAQEDVALNWTRIEQHLKRQGPYLLGEQYTVPDLFLYILSSWDECCANLYERFPSVKKLADLVGVRPAIQKMTKVNQG